jgi:hypothetical protein
MAVKMSRKFFLILAVIIQILLLINTTPANSWQIAQANEVEQNKISIGKEILDRGLTLLVGFLTIKQIGSASALETEVNDDVLTWKVNYETTNFAKADYSLDSQKSCCLKTFEGAICQEISVHDKETCPEENTLPDECNKISACQIGCCTDPEEGLCTTKSPRAKCELEGGIWNENEECLIKECEKGCCVLGGKVEFLTEKACEKASLGLFEKDFRDYSTEFACLALTETIEEGACVYPDGNCKFGFGENCIDGGGEFYPDRLCSHPSLETNCVKQSSVGCYDGLEEIYWFDSCGNRENIYSSDREKSWNKGVLLKKQDSCGWGSGNIDSKTCGNCNYFLSSKCKESSSGVRDGNYVCEDMGCTDEKGNRRENGESWCVYDSYIGEGKDVVGSRHWRRMCIDGEIKAEPCADYRGQICVESEIKKDDGSGTGNAIAQSSCVVNEAIKCLDYNQQGKEKMAELCEENPDCRIEKIDVDEGFKFDICVSNYPRGFDLSYSEGKTGSEQLCGMADQKCIVIYEKKISGWECIYNCDCEKIKFTEQLNNFCISLGDCGSYVNIIGKGTDSYSVKNAPEVSWEDYIGYESPVDGQFARPKPISKTMRELTGELQSIQDVMLEGQEGFFSSAINMIGTVSGMAGPIAQGVSWLNGESVNLAGQRVIDITSGVPVETIGQSGDVGFIPGLDQGTMAVADAIGAIGIGMTVSSILTMAFGLQGDAAMVMAVSGVAAGITLAILSWGQGAMAFCIGPQWIVCAGILLALILIATILKISGIGDIKEVEVEFKCKPWQAPFGADDCGACDDDPLRPCTKYRCESLGKGCGLINENTENPECIQKHFDDGKAPEINFSYTGSDFVSVDSSKGDIGIRRKDGTCIQEFEIAEFVLETNKYAYCKFDLEKGKLFSEMSNDFAEGNMFGLTHQGVFMLPSLSGMDVSNVSGDILDRYGETDLYVKCVDIFGNENTKDYVIDFCLQVGNDTLPPQITKFDPPNGALKKKGTENLSANLYLSEPAECRFDVLDREYENMERVMDCSTNISDYDSYGWNCKMNLQLKKAENKYFIRCRDQPWFAETENESKRNSNSEGTPYVIYDSVTDLKIDSISPSAGEVLDFGVLPALVKLKVKTSGGMMGDGRATCYFSFKEGGYKNEFKKTSSNEHEQTFNMIFNGKHSYFIECKDAAGNIARTNISFDLFLDNSPPEITRLYRSGANIEFITDEGAECFYDLESCNFNINNGTAIGGGFNNIHLLPLSTLHSYKIKCRDKWGNTNPECAALVKPGP